MTSVKSKIPLIIIILLTCVVIFLTLWDIIYEEQLLKLLDFIFKRQMLQRLLLLYGILIIFVIVVIFSRMSKESKAIPHYGKELGKSFESKMYHFKCPNCNGVFTIKKSNDKHNRSFIITCPSCGAIGRIPSRPKSGENKFECINCGGRVSIVMEETGSFHDVAVHSCPYCGEKQSMRSI